MTADQQPTLDAVLVGYVVLEDPATDEITEDWLAAPLWREALTILRGAQRRGQRLDLISAGKILAEAHCDFLACRTLPAGHEHDWDPENECPEGPHTGGSGIALPLTTAALAVVAASEVPLVAVLRQARERYLQLELTRLGRLLPLYADLEPVALFAALPTLRARCTEIELLADHYDVVPIDVQPSVEEVNDERDQGTPVRGDRARRSRAGRGGHVVPHARR